MCVCTCTTGINVSGKEALMMAFLVVPTKSSPAFPSDRARTGPNDSPTWTHTQHRLKDGSQRGGLTFSSGLFCHHAFSYLHLSLFSVVMVPQHHLTVLASSRHHGAVLQDTHWENPTLMGPRHYMADAVATCQSEYKQDTPPSVGFFLFLHMWFPPVSQFYDGINDMLKKWNCLF